MVNNDKSITCFQQIPREYREFNGFDLMSTATGETPKDQVGGGNHLPYGVVWNLIPLGVTPEDGHHPG